MSNNDVIIDTEFLAWLPRPTPEQFVEIETAIVAAGECPDKLVVWKEKNILVDGHTRKAICDKHDIPYEYRYQSFVDRTEALTWIFKFQNNRRNLNDFARAEIALRLEAKIADRKRQNSAANLRRGPDVGDFPPREKTDENKTTRDELAALADTSADIIRAVKTTQEHGTRALQEAARRGDIAPTTAAKVAKQGTPELQDALANKRITKSQFDRIITHTPEGQKLELERILREGSLRNNNEPQSLHFQSANLENFERFDRGIRTAWKISNRIGVLGFCVSYPSVHLTNICMAGRKSMTQTDRELWVSSLRSLIACFEAAINEMMRSD